ncbi:MAG: polysaccharide biosynthesis/export family protein [Planctomycetes bacterium]|nr:polysaccharide biosynthesis/export family protein [Planctomycetota bacterium]
MKADTTAEGHGTRARSPVRGPCPAMLLATLLAVAAGSAGCHGLFNSWLDPTAVGDFGAERTIEIRTSLSIQDSPLGVPGATTPTPDDLVPTRRPYRFISGDAMIVRIFELMARNTESVTQSVVDDMGNISLPFVGIVAVEGLSPRELEGDLKELLREREILNEAEVVVEPQIRRNSTFVVFGATAGSAIYPIATVDFRLLEALSLAGGLSDVVTDIYIFREEAVAAGDQTATVPGAIPTDAARPEMSSPAQPADAAPEAEDAEQTGAVEVLHLSGGLGEGATAGGGLYALPRSDVPPSEPMAAPPATQPDTQPADPEAERELIESIAPPARAAGDSATAPAEPADSPVSTTQSSFIFLNGKWIEIQPPSAAETPATRPVFDPQPTPAERFEVPRPTIDWEAIAGQEKQQRIIRVSAAALRDGDPRQNLVIRPGDTIRLVSGQTGEYYMMGQIGRPGAYGLSGRQLTLKAAIAAAGNLAPLAWPERCTVYRRLGEREEMIQVNVDRIFAGEEADFFVKRDDVIVFGTHPLSIFLAVVRNAFRLTYGFGFVYDRNFADVDNIRRSVAAQNKAAQAAQQNRFPGLFP